MKYSWKLLLQPLSKAIWWYLGLVFLRELFRLGGNYSMSAAFRVLDLLRTGGHVWVWAAFLAGTNRMKWPTFLLFNALVGIVWAAIYGTGGYVLGNPAASRPFTTASRKLTPSK